MPARYWFLGLVIGAGLLGWYAAVGRPVVATPALPPANIMTVSTAAPRETHAAMGNSGCAAQGCHGAVTSHAQPLSIWGTDAADRDRWRESATIFNGHDPHRLAFDTLKTDRSAAIQHLLQAKTPAWEDARCLACHANPTTASNPSASAKALHADGVSCEACHGNSSEWIDAHTKWDAGMIRYSVLDEVGMTRLDNVYERADTCVRCHVGAPAEGNIPRRDVNHDLIAAGHPRLNFDYATAMDRLPAHWVEKLREGVITPLLGEKQLLAPGHWRIGRQMANVAAYRLLADRAALAEANPQAWPEFAEHDCFACHRGLDPDRKKFSPTPTRLTGGLGREAPPLLHALLRDIPRTDDVEALMKKPGASPADIAKRATAAADEWSKARLLERHPGLRESQSIAKKLAEADLPITWAEACQRFYCLDYLNRVGQTGLDKQIDDIRPLLQFQRDPVEINSPATADLPLAGRKLREIAERLAQPAPPAEPAKK